MRLPIPFLLYTTALGLFAWAGWTVYGSLDLWKVETRTAATNKGRDDAVKLMARGKGKGPAVGDWNYGASNWWPQLKQINLIGKLPVVKPKPGSDGGEDPPGPPEVDQTPLEDIFELVSLVYDSKGDGTGANSHVIIRYKDEAGVEPPEWWVRENTAPTASARGAGGPRDLMAAPATAKTKRNGARGLNNRGINNRGNRNTNRARNMQQATQMPSTSFTGRAMLQKLWVDAGGNVRRSSKLWGKYSHIELVRVDPSAESAYFKRPQPKGNGDKSAEGGAEGDDAAKSKGEQLFKTTTDISQDVMRAIRQLQGREGEGDKGGAKKPSGQSRWRDVETTTRFGNEFHIGRKDERSFRNTDDFFANVYVDTYVSKTTDRRGLSVRNIKPAIAQAYGVQTGDVLISVNNRKVSSKAQAVNMVKGDYKRGVRSFTTEWLSNGQKVTRVYQAPTKK